MKIPITLYAVVARIINKILPVKQKHWIFGADYGNMYREGSKYLLQYMLEHHTDYNCTFITRNKTVKAELDNKGIPCEMNFTLKGMETIAQAEIVFTCQDVSDILFTYKKKGRGLYYLVHGQPFKVAMDLLLQKDFESLCHRSQSSIWGPLQSYKRKIIHYLCIGYDRHDVDFVSATSDFTAFFLQREWKNINVKVLGMPRNDALFQPKRMQKEKWMDGLEGKKVVTYMPTHRKYGKGNVSPIPFLNNKEVQQWMYEHNVVLLIKQHPNMINHYMDNIVSDVIIDISRAGYDPQVVIYHSDILITDYSSVWMDYLLLRRPLIFYFYDDFETNDVGCYYNLREEFPNNYCETEDALSQMIKKSIENPSEKTPSEAVINKFHKYVDGNSCERYFNAIVNNNYAEG